MYPSLHTHEIEPLSRRYGMKVWQSYLENKTSKARRMYWVYGADQGYDVYKADWQAHWEKDSSVITLFWAKSQNKIDILLETMYTLSKMGNPSFKGDVYL